MNLFSVILCFVVFTTGCCTFSSHNRVADLMDEISQLRLQYGDLQQNYVDLHAKVNADYAVFSASIQDLQSKVPLLSKSCLVKENDDGFTSPSSVYGRAYGDYLAKRYELAHSGFESFVNKYPNDVRVAEARTCMSECLKMFDKDGS